MGAMLAASGKGASHENHEMQIHIPAMNPDAVAGTLILVLFDISTVQKPRFCGIE